MSDPVPPAWAAWERLMTAEQPDAMEVIRVAAMYQRYFFELQDKAVRLARAQGRTWEEIGQAVGTTRQAAWQRYGRVAPAAPAFETLRRWLDPATAPRIFGQTLVPPEAAPPPEPPEPPG